MALATTTPIHNKKPNAVEESKKGALNKYKYACLLPSSSYHHLVISSLYSQGVVTHLTHQHKVCTPLLAYIKNWWAQTKPMNVRCSYVKESISPSNMANIFAKIQEQNDPTWSPNWRSQREHPTIFITANMQICEKKKNRSARFMPLKFWHALKLLSSTNR